MGKTKVVTARRKDLVGFINPNRSNKLPRGGKKNGAFEVVSTVFLFFSPILTVK